jgi:hypothetical protein
MICHPEVKGIEAQVAIGFDFNGGQKRTKGLTLAVLL